jgi:hypothetical protein
MIFEKHKSEYIKKGTKMNSLWCKNAISTVEVIRKQQMSWEYGEQEVSKDLYGSAFSNADFLTFAVCHI